MDKYHIYEEVGAGQHSQVFKGREKMDIEYVAIKRIEKSMMESVVKEVQVIHRLSSPNVLKFYDWYETRNNVWLILEFCTGGDLLTLIKQDHREPESAVRLFGVDLLAGLQQTHACGYLHGDLRPSNVLIDEYGILKLSGFGLARSVPEGGEGGAELDGGTGDSSTSGQKRQQQGCGGVEKTQAGDGVGMGSGRDPTYMAPELLSGGEGAMSFASDFWSLGCVLFELLTGEPPFRASASATIAEKIKRESPPGLDKGEWQGVSMSTQFCELTSWLLQKDPLLRPTWPQLLAHPFWGNCQTPSALEMPPQPRFDRALATFAAAAAAATAVSAAAARTAAEDTYAADQSRGSLERSETSQQGHDGAAALSATAPGNHGAQAGKGMGGSPSYADLSENTREAGRWEGQGRHTEEQGEEEAEERDHRWRPEEANGGTYGGGGVRGGADGCQRTAACTGRASPVSEQVGSPGNPRGVQGGGGGGREGCRETTPPRAFPDTAETEQWRLTGPSEGPPAPERPEDPKGPLDPEGQPPNGRRSAEQHRRNNGHDTRNGDLNGAAAAHDDGHSHSGVAGKGQDSGLPSPIPPAPLAASVDRRKAAACHGLSQNVVGESVAANEAGCRTAGMRGRKQGDPGANADAGKTATAAAAAAALSGLRMRGRIPPARGGRSSPSVVSVVSVSSSAGEQYGSSFEEDTEVGSSSCSANGGTSGGGGSGSVGSGSACSGGGGRSGGFGELGTDPSLVARAAPGKAKGLAGRGGRDAGAAVVMTPGSIGTATTATPSTGAASSTRGRRGSSSSYAASAVRVGRESAAARKQNANAAADSDATTSSPCVGGRRPQRASPISSAGSTSGPDRARSRLDFPPTAAAGAASVGSGSSSASPSFTTTALRFEQVEGSPVSERVSISSWTLSSGVSTTRFSRETEAYVGVSSSGWDGSASRPQEAQEGRVMPERAPVEGADVDLRNSRSGVVGGDVDISMKGSNRSPAGRISGDDPRRGSPKLPAQSVAPNHDNNDDNDGDYDSPQANAKGNATRSGEAVGSAVVARSASPEGRGVQELLLHTSDAQVTPIVGSRCVEPTRAQAEPSRDQLPFEALPLGVVSAMPPPALETHLTVAYNALTETQAPVRQTGQTLLYLQSLAPIPRVSNLLINSTFLVLLLRLLRKPRPAAIRDTVATLLGLLVRHATYIAPAAGRAPRQSNSVRGGGGGSGSVAVDGEAGGDRSGSMARRRRDGDGGDPNGAGGGLMPALISTIRDRHPLGRSSQAAALRRNTVAALGELLFYVVTQEPRNSGHEASGDDAGDGEEGRAWTIPSADVGDAIHVCLEDTEHGGGQHYAAKTVENVLAQAGPFHPLVHVFVTPELALCLFKLARRAPSESLRGTAAAGLSHLLAHDVLGAGSDDNSFTTTGRPVGCGAGVPGRRLQDDEKLTAHSCESGYGQAVKNIGARRGWIAARVMSEAEAPAAVVKGLSEGSFPASRRAFLNVFNLVLWVSRRFGGTSEGAITAGGRDGDESAVEGAGYGMGEGTSALRRAIESMLRSEYLLPRLLHVAEHGEGAVHRAKGFLALRLALEVAPPALLLKACRSRLLPLLARVLGGLTPRTTRGPGACAGAAVAAAVAAPGLFAKQEYLYECCIKLADWLSAVPETAARRLLTELRRCRTGVVRECQNAWRPRGASSSRRPIRQPTVVAAVAAVRTTELETAMAMFPAVVHLVNSPLLHRRAVTRAFLYDVAGCLSLSYPTTRERPAADREDDVGTVGVGYSAASAADASNAEGSGPEAALAALLPTVETLAQQTELVLLPHWETVSAELVPVLCRLLESPSGDTRALALAVLRVLLPPFMRQTYPPEPQSHFLDQAATAATPKGGSGGAQSVATVPPGEVRSPTTMRSAIAVHLLPRTSALLSDHTPVPQYTVRLLIDVGREWDGLSTALLAEAGALPALLGRLPPPTPSTSTSASPLSGATHSVVSSPRSQRAADTRRPGRGPGDGAVAALDPAVAALLALLVERDDGSDDDDCSDRSSGVIRRPVGCGSDTDSGGEELFAELLRLELPGRVAAAVTGALAAGMPEAMEAFLALAVALLGAGYRYEQDARQGRRQAGPNGDNCLPRGSGFGRPNATGGERTAGSNGRSLESGAKEKLGPLLAAVPASVEGVKSFCVRDVLARRREQLSGARREPLVNDHVRSGISDSATLFLEMCYKVFDDDLLWSLLFCSSRAAVGNAAFGSALSAPSPAARSCRHLADFLGCPDVDERPRLRILHLLLAAASARDRTFHGAVGQGLLWTALLRLATGRGEADSSGRSRSVRGATAATMRSGGGAPLGPMNVLAKEVVAAIREDRNYYGADSRRWSGRAGGGDA